MATIKVTDKQNLYFGRSIHRPNILKVYFPTSNCFDIMKKLWNGISCSEFAHFSLIPYDTDSSFVDRLGPNVVQGLNFGCQLQI